MNKNSEISEIYWRRVRRYLPLLSFFPHFRMIAICNNLAFGKISELSDIDLFLIIRRGRLFTGRLLATAILHLCGVRRHGSKIAGRFCLSFFMDDSDLSLARIAIDDDIYLAYWLKSLKPVLDDNCAMKFLTKNLWALDFFADSTDFQIDFSQLMSRGRISKFFGCFYQFFDILCGNFLESVLRRWQLLRARRKGFGDFKNAVVIDEHILKFHLNDRREFYRDLWRKKYGQKALLTDRKFSEVP